MRSSGWTIPLTALALLTSPAEVPAQGTAQPGQIPFEQYTLDNGLHVILSRSTSVPVVAVDVWYHVGAANERPGRTGFAHLFEHMLFQGSDNVAKGEHMQLVERAGGSLNGSTGSDRTNYYQTLPASRLNLGLWLEADRMRSLAVTQENLDNQREVVKEERRMRVDNAPYGTSIRGAIADLTYNTESCFAYGHEGIGSMADLDAAELEDVRAFFDLYYVPNNAVLTVVGDFDPAQARALIQEYFGSIPRGGEIPRVECRDPFSHLPVRHVVPDANANLPALFAAYGLPPAGDADVAPMRLLSAILAGGESSRLNQRLVREERAAVSVFSFPDFRRGPGVFVVAAIANQGAAIDRLQQLLDEEMAKVRDAGVPPEELEKAKNQYRAGVVREAQTVLGRAEALQEAMFFHRDPGAVSRELEQVMAVTQEDIRRAAGRYLADGNRSIVITEPAPAAQE